jgi:DNA-binding response OmpR family regulator
MKLPSLRILVADDNADTVESLAMLLQLEGHETVVCYDGIQAVDLSLGRCPQMAILDINMPELDGYATACFIRYRWADLVYIAALTAAFTTEEASTQACAAGFDTFMVKPVSAEDLFAAVAAAQRRALATSPPPRLAPARLLSRRC